MGVPTANPSTCLGKAHLTAISDEGDKGSGMLASMFIVAMAIMKLWPQMPTARWLHRALVEIPLELVARLERKHLIFVAIVLTAMLALTMMGPLDMALVGMWDIAVYLDVATAVVAISVVARGRSVWLWVRAWVVGVAGRIGARRPRPRAVRPRIKRGVNDDDGDGRFWSGFGAIPLAA